MVTKLINRRDRAGFQELNQRKNLQLESLYLREAHTRIQAWKRYHDEISRQRCNWPPPINGKIYNKREEAIYNMKTNNYNYDSWFHRHIYKNDLIKASQQRHRMYDLDRSLTEKKTKIENEVMQLREKLQTFQLNNMSVQPMYPVQPSIRYLLYNGTSKELEGRLNYLNRRKLYAPDEKYCEPLCSSWDITWNLKDFYKNRIVFTKNNQ
jgi:hypothetical protein